MFLVCASWALYRSYLGPSWELVTGQLEHSCSVALAKAGIIRSHATAADPQKGGGVKNKNTGRYAKRAVAARHSSKAVQVARRAAKKNASVLRALADK